MVILVQCGKSPIKKWLKFSQNGYLAKAKGFLKCGVILILGPNKILWAEVLLCIVGELTRGGSVAVAVCVSDR